jgi:hypothetical protein
MDPLNVAPRSNDITGRLEIAIHDVRGLQARGGAIGTWIGPQLTQNERGRGRIARIPAIFDRAARCGALARAGALWQGSARLWKPFWPILIVRGTLP